MSALSRFYPTKPVDVTRWLKPLPSDGSLPCLPDWRWLHTPGHSPGHVSFWREDDKSLIVGDAFVTTRAESAYATATQEPELHGPPAYFTINWDEAKQSLQALAALKPHLVVSGHGRALSGSHMQVCLDELARDFDRIARPPQGRYIDHPV
jgi:glyoxylase-like metal-dependent hydrolase (beta-lactamase superfamily II)